MRPTIYDGVGDVYGEMNDIMKLQTNLNNPNKWLDNVPAKTGYYTQHNTLIIITDHYQQFKLAEQQATTITTIICYFK
jgi:hypothetical protein